MVCEELFGTVAEEKTIQGITVKLHEAKSKKSNDIIEILATFVTSGSFAPMIKPLKQVCIVVVVGLISYFSCFYF